jgi:hypothetical protein
MSALTTTLANREQRVGSCGSRYACQSARDTSYAGEVLTRVIAIAGTLLACACGGSGGAGGGSGGPGPAPTYDETEAPVAVTVTAEEGGTLASASALLEVTFPEGVVTEPTEMSVVRLTDEDVPPDAFLGIAHRVEPVLSYYNSVPTGVWTIPASLVRAAFGAAATPAKAPLPIPRAIDGNGSTMERLLYVTEYVTTEGGGFELTASLQTPASALYISTSHAIAEVTAAAPTANEPGGARFTIKPAPGSGIVFVDGSIGSSSTSNWDRGGGTIESDGEGGLVGSFLGSCDFGGYSAALNFEVQAHLTVDDQPLNYNVWLGTSVSCPR